MADLDQKPVTKLSFPSAMPELDWQTDFNNYLINIETTTKHMIKTMKRKLDREDILMTSQLTESLIELTNSR